ncbi:MAG: HAD family phosphatase [Candidatus Doudnabacteria bacterium]|nr:HAD family phosphatase [Candidatus Doudnabacteria bacterium]
MIKAIFFDSGNVLVREGFTAGIKEYEAAHGIKPGLLYASAHDGVWWKDFTLGNISEQEYFQKTAEDFKQALDVEDLKKLILKNFSPNRELLGFLAVLKSRFTLGVISNNPKEWFDYFWQQYHWGEIFTIKAVSSYLHIRKPDVKIYEYALQQAGVSGSEALYIDDRPDRIEGAEQLAMKILIYKNVEQLKKELQKL